MPDSQCTTEPILLLKCCSCKQFKGTSEYLKHHSNARGYQYECRTCRKESRRKYIINHPAPQISEARRAVKRKSTKIWKTLHRKEVNAQKAVEYRRLIGAVIQPAECSSCGEVKKRLHAHHDDYSKPLEVRWLCPRCHRLHHTPQL